MSAAPPKMQEAGPVTVREVRLEDAEEVARLTTELGYPASAGEMIDRIRAQMALPDHAIYVALVNSGVAGWIDVRITHYLQAGPRAEIGGLVVAAEARSLGIGRRLLTEAERWALERGIAQMVVRSRVDRERAHQFYLREGYSRTKTSAVFTKELGPRPKHWLILAGACSTREGRLKGGCGQD